MLVFTQYLLRLVMTFVFSLAAAVHAAETLILQPAQMQSLGIVTQVVSEAAPGRGNTFPAKVLVPNEQMRVLAAPVAGRIEMLAVVPGSTVRRGQVLVHLASPQALELQRDAVQAASQATLLEQNLKREEQLFAEGLIAESRLQATRAAAMQAAAAAKELRQKLALAGIVPSKVGGPLALVSPIDGVVLEQGVELGQWVEASTLIYRLAKLSPLWLEIQVPVAVATKLHEGAPVKLTGSNVLGKLIAIGRAVDPASQTVLLRAAVDKGAETLIPGQMIEVELPLATGQHLTLPASALVRYKGRTLVFVQTSSNGEGIQFEVRPVTVLDEGGDSVQVSGLNVGESVAVKGVSSLKAIYTGVGGE